MISGSSCRTTPEEKRRALRHANCCFSFYIEEVSLCRRNWTYSVGLLLYFLFGGTGSGAYITGMKKVNDAMAELTEKQKRFADYYIESGNATDSYQRAYNCKRETADANGTRMLGNARILQYIENRNQQLSNNRIATMQEVKEFWSTVLRSTDLEMKDRLKASEFIAKTNAAFIDRHEHSGETGVRIINDIPRPVRN